MGAAANSPGPFGCDVLVFGEYFCDLIITGLPEPPRLGADLFGQDLEIAPGGAYILTTALHRLGVQVCWATHLGNDLFSRFVIEAAQREGLDTSLFVMHDRPLRSMSLSFSFTQDRGFISYIDPFPATDSAAILRAHRPRWVVNTPFNGAAHTRRLVEQIHAQGGRVYTDCQYVTTTLDEPGLADLLRVTDIFAPNLSEGQQLTGEQAPEHVAARLAEFCPLVVVKCGAAGAVACAGAQLWQTPALQVPVVDTTGAGDSFNAGFLTALLHGLPVETCLRYGNICGGLSVTQPGGASAAPTLSQLQAYL